MTAPLRIALVGCGAVARENLLPPLAGHDEAVVAALVDRDLHRARELAAAYGVPGVHRDIAELSRDAVDAVVVATPPRHHAPATIDLAGRGFHVLVEKPMALCLEEAEAMVQAADAAGVVLSVGLYRRLLPAARLLRALVEEERFGRPLAIDIEEGGVYGWQLATLSVLTRAEGGGGVLIDLGTHLLDQLMFLVPGDARVVEYRDNARGGVETDCELRLALDTRWGEVPARIELSRTRELRGTIRVECERGTLELVRGDFCALRLRQGGEALIDPVTGTRRALTQTVGWSDQPMLVGYQAFRNEIDDWLEAIRQRREPQLSGRSVLPVVRTIDACYQSRAPLPEPWVDAGMSRPEAPGLGTGGRRRVLVTGAGGFLGCRTVETLLARGWDVRALVRQPASAARLARFELDIRIGDVESRDDMARAVEGCDAVVHCAVGTSWPPAAAFRTTVEGTRRVADAALDARVSRFVHISSMAVHGTRLPPRLDESAPLDPGEGFDYGRAKYLAEEAVADAARRGLPAISLRPARIYGPFSRTFTIRPLQALRDGRLVLAGDAESPANMVYVDNVVEAIVRALEAPDRECGGAFLISEPDQLSWRGFYEFFAGEGRAVRVVARTNEPAAAAPGLAARWGRGLRQIAFSPEVRALAKRVLATDPVGTWPRAWWERSPGLQRRVQQGLGIDRAVVYREPAPPSPDLVEFRIDPTLVVFDRASERLGYRGEIRREEGMALTRAWARWARLL